MLNLPNVIIDKNMKLKLQSNTLSMLDELKITLANFATDLFKASKVYINANRQNSEPPCLFVSFYEVGKKQKLYNNAVFEIGFNIAYIADDELSNTELTNSLFLLEQNITDIKEYAIKGVTGNITDGIANVSGTIKLLERNLENIEIIKKIKREIKTK